MQRFLRFCAVGVLGFVIDASITTLLSTELQPLLARVPAFLAASIATYNLNRAWSFSHTGSSSWRGYRTYVVTTSVGALINYAVFMVVVIVGGSLTWVIVTGVALGALAGLVFNYAAASRVVFRK